jgi:O-antigen/teichoic acid export membrane protein
MSTAMPLKGSLLQGVLGTGMLKLVHAACALLVAISLARLLGPEGYGTYAYAFSLMALVAVPAQLGLPTLVLRETAKLKVGEEWPLLRGLFRWSNAVGLGLALLLALAAAAVAWGVGHASHPELVRTFWWALLLMPVIALGNLRGAALRGLGHVVLGQLPEFLLRPGFLLLLLLLAGSWMQLTPQSAMLAHLAAAGLALAIGAWFLLAKLPAGWRGAGARYEPVAWMRSVVPLSLLAGMQVANAQVGVIALGAFGEAGEVGLYRAAMQAALAVSFALVVANTVIAPHVSHLHARGDQAALQAMLSGASRTVFLASLAAAIVLVACGPLLLALLFGEDFVPARVAFAILCAGYVANTLFGAADLVLNMTGNERVTALGFAVATVANGILCLWLVPRFGMNGAAMAAAVSQGLWAIALAWRAWIRAGLWTPAFPVPRGWTR